MKKIITSLFLFSLSLLASAQTKVYYVELQDGAEISSTPVKEYTQTSPSNTGNEIILYPDIELQEIQGIGGTFNEIGGVALMSLPASDREAVMANLFGKNGAQLSLCRTAIGASDFGVDAYSYSEQEGDYNMDHFSIEREANSVIPYIQMAYKNNPEMQLFGSPWSPPAWMKYSKSMDKGLEMTDKNHLINDPKIYKAYALYFSKYVSAYAKEGITVDRLVIQNENDAHTQYPSCVMPVDQMYKFISKYLRPQFDKDKQKCEIWAGTFRTAGTVDGIEFVSNPTYLDAVDGIGIQYTSPNYTSDIKYFAKDKPLMHTECDCHNGDNSAAQAFGRLDELAQYLNYGTINFSYWNMILDETSKSGWGWKQNSMIKIDRTTQTVTYNPDYAAVSLFSRFIQPGSHRIASFAREVVVTSKIDGKVHIFVKNDSDKTKDYVCKEAGKQVASATVPAHSLAVIVY